MGENQQNQSSPSVEAGGIYKNEQYLRLIREEDESWISGEELRTDGSSDDDKSSPHRHLHNKKQNKKVKTRPKLARCDSDDPPKDISIPVVPLSYGKARFDDDLPRSDLASSPEDLSSEAGCSRHLDLADTLDLENRWRPKRGSLKLPNLTDGFLEEFYTNMSQTIRELRSFEQKSKFDKRTTEKFGEIKDKVQDLDTKIKENLKLLQSEQTERLETQNALYEDLSNDSTTNRNTSIFLEMCRIELKHTSEKHDGTYTYQLINDLDYHKDFKDFVDLLEENPPQKPSKKAPKAPLESKDFIKRNVELAPKMSTNLPPLTNEEEDKLQALLADLENGDDHFDKHYTENEINNLCSGAENEEEENDEVDYSRNAFKFCDGDKRRMEEIDGKLGNFEEVDSRPTKDLTSLESLKSTSPSAVSWKDLVLAVDIELEKFQDGENNPI